MDRVVLFVFLVNLLYAEARMICDRDKDNTPLESGVWRHDMHHMDTAVIENPPVTVSEGQLYVYENDFPNRTIQYLHVDNVAMKTCGARASLKSGGVGTSSVLIVLHAGPYNEIRSVIDIWGTKSPPLPSKSSRPKEIPESMKNLKSLYLFSNMRAVNHNYHEGLHFPA